MRGAARGALTALMLAVGVLADDTTPPPSSFPTHFPTAVSPTVSPTRFPTTLSPTRKKCYEVRESRPARQPSERAAPASLTPARVRAERAPRAVHEHARPPRQDPTECYPRNGNYSDLCLNGTGFIPDARSPMRVELSYSYSYSYEGSYSYSYYYSYNCDDDAMHPRHGCTLPPTPAPTSFGYDYGLEEFCVFVVDRVFFEYGLAPGNLWGEDKDAKCHDHNAFGVRNYELYDELATGCCESGRSMCTEALTWSGVPVPAPTSTPAVVVNIMLSIAGIDCDNYGDADQAVVNEALAATIPGTSAGSSFGEHSCYVFRRRKLLQRDVRIEVTVSVLIEEFVATLDADSPAHAALAAADAHSVDTQAIIAEVSAVVLEAETSGELITQLALADAASEADTAIDWSDVSIDAITCTTQAPTTAPVPRPTSAPTDNFFVLGAAGRASAARLGSVFCAAVVAAGFWF